MKAPLTKFETFPVRHPRRFVALFLCAALVVWTFALLCYFPSKIDFEEQYYGTLPKDILEGLIGTLRDYETQSLSLIHI